MDNSADIIQTIIDLMGREVRMEIRNADGGTWVRLATVAGIQAPLNDRDETWVIVENYRTDDELIAVRTLVGISELASIHPAA